MTTAQELIKKLQKAPPNGTVMLGGMVIGGDPIDVEVEKDDGGDPIVWLT